jgi:hypothetical protein
MPDKYVPRHRIPEPTGQELADYTTELGAAIKANPEAAGELVRVHESVAEFIGWDAATIPTAEQVYRLGWAATQRRRALDALLWHASIFPVVPLLDEAEALDADARAIGETANILTARPEHPITRQLLGHVA